MSLIVQCDTLSNAEIRKLNIDLEVRISDKKGFVPDRMITLYEISADEERVYLPFAYATQTFQKKRRPRDEFLQTNVKFEAKLREEQVEIKNEAIQQLNQSGSVMISCYTGFGKTVTAIKIATCIKLQTLIIANRVQLLKQWKSAITKFCPSAIVQILETKTEIIPNADFYIMNAINIPKMGDKCFLKTGLCIIDESHLIVAESLSRCLRYIYPRYLIGLTATPYRPDGLDILLDIYLGTYKIIRKLYREHIVYKVRTHIAPKIETTEQGRINWNVVINSLSENNDRNILIVQLIQKFPERNFLVLSKRVKQGKFLLNALREVGESVTSLIGTEQKYDEDARILIGMTQKCGTGFDHPKMDTLILACDVDEYFIQILGRIFRRKDTIPLVFDLVDKHPILERHFESRKDVYTDIGGKIKSFELKPKLL